MSIEGRYRCVCGEVFEDKHATGVGTLAPAECPRCGEEERVGEAKPLHVQVAEALGWRDVRNPPSVSAWYGGRPGSLAENALVPNYDTDWSATGPLIERYKIALLTTDFGWRADVWPMGIAGHTPLEAVCRLILALKAEGKLNG